MNIHNNFGSFYFLSVYDKYNIIEHKMSVIGPKRIVRNYFKIKVKSIHALRGTSTSYNNKGLIVLLKNTL